MENLEIESRWKLWKRKRDKDKYKNPTGITIIYCITYGKLPELKEYNLYKRLHQFVSIINPSFQMVLLY